MNTKDLLIFRRAFFVLLTTALIAGCSRTVEHDLVIKNVNVIDVKSGKILKNQTVAIDSNRISNIYNKEVLPSNETHVINGENKYLIPGLWDMHAHYFWNHEDTDPLLIANGVTGVREMWGDMKIINEARNKNKTGEIIAPDIYTAGVIIDGKPPHWPGSIGVSTPEEAKITVKKQIEEGVDFIKVLSLLSEECFMAIADEANKNNIPFAGHIPQSVSTIDAIDAGMASSEHFIGILEACSSNEDSLKSLPWSLMKHSKFLIDGFVESKFDSLCGVLANSNMWLCPTMTINRTLSYWNDSSFTNDSRLEFVSPDYTYDWNLESPDFQEYYERYFIDYRRMYHFELDLIGRMNEKGVKFLAGTDYPNPYCFPGFSLHDELALLVEGGMSELEVLKAATINGAIFMGKENELGTVEPGKLASCILLNENPLENIENTKSIETVILRGKVFDRLTLDEMLEQTKTNAAKIPYSVWLRSKISSASLDQALDSLNIMITTNYSKYKLQEEDLNLLGYEYLNSGDLEIAQSIFKTNIELFPESFNVYDSYAEACMKAGQHKQAIKFYKKSLEINPDYYGAKIMLDSISVLMND